jgi:MFS family permease
MSSISLAATAEREASQLNKIILACSLGTIFEWYDFFLYASLASIIAKQFFSAVNPTASFIFALLAFSAGFVVRPFGAIFFGRFGDLAGRKFTFLITIVLMGLSTFGVGLLPAYEKAGMLAPIVLIALRLIQGLAIGGEYGGAVVYVAEHAPKGRRGFYTGFVQTTPALGLLLSLIIILGLRQTMSEAVFADWGWRLPFLGSALMLAFSIWLRMEMSETPAFIKMAEDGKRSPAPLVETFGTWKNAKMMLIALFGGAAGSAVVWQTAQLYTLFFLTRTLGVEMITANILIGVMLVASAPMFVFFGWLSDYVGRKPIILIGCLLAALTYFPLFKAMARYANPEMVAAQLAAPVTVIADPKSCSFQFNPAGTSQFTTSCDVAKSLLASKGISYSNEPAFSGAVAKIRIGAEEIDAVEATGPDAKARIEAFSSTVLAKLRAAQYPAAADPATMNKPMVEVILLVLVAYGSMVFGPVAVQLAELFPTRVRYSGVSFPYHVGNGWFGGLLPAVAFAIVAATGDIYSGLWYPIVIASLAAFISLIFMPETRGKDIYADLYDANAPRGDKHGEVK